MNCTSIDLLQKRVPENGHTHKETNRQTDRIGPILSSSGTVFGPAKSQIPLADASKRCPENNTPNSLRNPVNGHLRLASVVALSSSGACGAIISIPLILPYVEAAQHLARLGRNPAMSDIRSRRSSIYAVSTWGFPKLPVTS